MHSYVGKHIADLTLAQIKTLDCGSKRLNDFRMTSPLVSVPLSDTSISPTAYCPEDQDQHAS